MSCCEGCDLLDRLRREARHLLAAIDEALTLYLGDRPRTLDLVSGHIADSTGRLRELASNAPCPYGCGCITEEDPDQRDCACDGPCTMGDDWPIPLSGAPQPEADDRG